MTQVATSTTSEKDPPRSAARDHRLDFWRGLCLIDMVLVHMVYEGIYFGSVLGPILSEYVRFAAGGFIFIAGMSVGAIFLPRAATDAQTRRKTYVALLRRAGWILVIHWLAGITFYWLDVALGRLETAPPFWAELWKLLTLRAGGDLLPFYVIMIALSPAMIELIRRGLWWGLAIVSVGLFIYGQRDPTFGSFPFPDPRFHVILWQLIFVVGMLAGAALPRYDALTRRGKSLIGLAAACGFAIVFWSDYASRFGWFPLDVGLTFRKIPLSDGELIRYLTLIGVILIVTDLAWPLLRERAAVGFTRQLGRKSLAVYVAHVWLVSILATYAWRLYYVGLWYWQGLLAIPALGLLWCYAWAWEKWGWKTRRKKLLASPAPVLAATGS